MIIQTKGVPVLAHLVTSLDLNQPLINLTDFSTSYRYVGWSEEGNVCVIDTTESTVSMEVLM